MKVKTRKRKETRRRRETKERKGVLEREDQPQDTVEWVAAALGPTRLDAT